MVRIRRMRREEGAVYRRAFMVANTGGQGKRLPFPSVVAVTRHSGGVLTARLHIAKRTVTWRTMEHRRGDSSHQL